MTVTETTHAPLIEFDGATVAVRFPELGTWQHRFYRDELATAYLLWLDANPAEPAGVQAYRVRWALTHRWGIDAREAWRLTRAAELCVRHGVEP